MTSVNTTTIAFQTAYNFLAQGRVCKLYRREDGQWKCEEVGK